MFTLPKELRAQGERAEADFRAWLDASGVAYMYIEQSPLTVPAGLRRRIKRPDYLVGIPYAGSLAFDVKAKSLSEGQLIFDHAEVDKLVRFARLFNLTAYFACLEPREAGRHWWVPLANLQNQVPEWRNKRRVYCVPIATAFEVQTESLFLDAVLAFGRRALAVEAASEAP